MRKIFISSHRTWQIAALSRKMHRIRTLSRFREECVLWQKNRTQKSMNFDIVASIVSNESHFDIHGSVLAFMVIRFQKCCEEFFVRNRVGLNDSFNYLNTLIAFEKCWHIFSEGTDVHDVSTILYRISCRKLIVIMSFIFSLNT